MKRYTCLSIIYLFILISFSCQKELRPIDERWQFISGKRELAVSGISPTTDKDKYLVGPGDQFQINILSSDDVFTYKLVVIQSICGG